ncbi:hypothetical protein [Natrinema salaciae]|uniref:Uncharacterized protein n=1 Tax=Natrinema salaciae TaxID=1186196 RepID=A0A1H9S6N2_9EURY|nr:hypothetical protein [Natrinema salaciae]SER80003.1 hypothetical protein SAMN04489841_4582 [Natrinema salaciae]
MCEHSPECSNGVTCQLVLENGDTGLETAEYYCKAHLVLRIWEVENDSSMRAVSAEQL